MDEEEEAADSHAREVAFAALKLHVPQHRIDSAKAAKTATDLFDIATKAIGIKEVKDNDKLIIHILQQMGDQTASKPSLREANDG